MGVAGICERASFLSVELPGVIGVVCAIYLSVVVAV
jgi:hypothetical protein